MSQHFFPTKNFQVPSIYLEIRLPSKMHCLADHVHYSCIFLHWEKTNLEIQQIRTAPCVSIWSTQYDSKKGATTDAYKPRSVLLVSSRRDLWDHLPKCKGLPVTAWQINTVNIASRQLPTTTWTLLLCFDSSKYARPAENMATNRWSLLFHRIHTNDTC